MVKEHHLFMVLLCVLAELACKVRGFSLSMMSTKTPLSTVPSWEALKNIVGNQAVGQALNKEVQLREAGFGSAHVQNKLRKFRSDVTDPPITLYRDHAGWYVARKAVVWTQDDAQSGLGR
jgi:hypothetical protein